MNLWVNDDDGEIDDDDDDDDNDNDMLLMMMTMKPLSPLQKDDLAPPRSSSSGCDWRKQLRILFSEIVFSFIFSLDISPLVICRWLTGYLR